MASCAWHKLVRSSRTYFHPLPVFTYEERLLLPYSRGRIFLYLEYITIWIPEERRKNVKLAWGMMCRRKHSQAIIWSQLNADNGFFLVWPRKTSSNPQKEENLNSFAGKEKKKRTGFRFKCVDVTFISSLFVFMTQNKNKLFA